MALSRKKKRGGAPPSDMPFQVQNSLSVEAFDAASGPTINALGGTLAKGASALADGGGVIGGLAKSGLRAARSVPLDSAVDAVTNAAGEVARAAGPAAGAVAGAAGDVLSGAAGLAGPALEAAGDAAGAVLGAVAEAAGDVLS